jgi:predicted lipoprotein with Yx(FWY)xxD motif
MTHSFETPATAPEPRSPLARPAARRWLLGAGSAATVTALVLAVMAGPGTAAAATATVDVGSNASFGPILTNAQGFALYTFANDHNGMSSCTGTCAQVWPPLTVPAGTTPSAGPGATGAVAAVHQANGTDQVTYNGSPLYTFLSDTSPGQATGNGVAGFSVVKVAAAPAPTTPPPAPTTPTAPPTTAAPTPAPPSSGVTHTTPPTTAPATAPAGSSPATAATSAGAPTAGSASASSPTASGAPQTLAVTGPGPALTVLAVVGAGLIALSFVLALFVLVGRRRRPGPAR